MKLLINSAQQAIDHPLTWEHPIEEIKKLKKGQYIKIGVHSLDPKCFGERFWAKVLSVSKTKQTALVKIEQSDMLFSDVHGYNHNDKVTVNFDNICSVWEEE